MNYSIIISPLFRLLYLSYPSTHGYFGSFSVHFFEKILKKLMRLFFGGAYFWGRLLFFLGGGGGGGGYYRSLISSLQQMRLLLGGAYYRGALIIGSLRYAITQCFKYLKFNFIVPTIGKLKQFPISSFNNHRNQKLWRNNN